MSTMLHTISGTQSSLCLHVLYHTAVLQDTGKNHIISQLHLHNYNTGTGISVYTHSVGGKILLY